MGKLLHYSPDGAPALYTLNTSGPMHHAQARDCYSDLPTRQEFGVVGYTLLLSVIEYKTLVLRGDMEAAAEILPQIPQVCANV